MLIILLVFLYFYFLIVEVAITPVRAFLSTGSNESGSMGTPFPGQKKEKHLIK